MTVAVSTGTIRYEAETVEELVALVKAFDAGGEDGWIAWCGGKCPLSDNTRIEVKYRNGHELRLYVSQIWSWKHYNSDNDIVAYRVVK